MFKLNNYNFEYKCRKGRGGGVGLYLQSKLKYTRLTCKEIANAECMWFKIENGLPKPVIVGVIYRKPSGEIEDFCYDLNDVLHELQLDRNQCVITGDFNINVFEKNEKIDDFLSMMECYGLTQLISSPTCITNNSSSLIDHIYSNISSCQTTSGRFFADISDHLPTYVVHKDYFQRHNRKPKFHTQDIKFRSYANYSTQALHNDLEKISWQDVYDCSDVNKAYDSFISTLQNIFDKHAPLKCVKRKRQTIKKPWISSAIANSIKQKYRLYKKAVKSKFNDELTRKYKCYRNILTSVLRKAKKLYYSELFDRDKNDIRKTWKHVNEILHKKNVIKTGQELKSWNQKLMV